MSDEQLNALEDWITAIIAYYNPCSGINEAIHRRQLKDAVRRAFGIIDGEE